MKTGLLSVPLATFLQKSPAVVLALIIGLLAYQLALLTWAFVPEEKPAFLWNPVAAKNNKNTVHVETEKLRQQHLFGEKSLEAKPSEKKVANNNAPITNLNLTLVGVVAASNPKYSSAIIEQKGAQESYFIDSKIDGTEAIITKILQDRILFAVKGFEQTLMLDGLDTVAKEKPKSKKKTSRKKSSADKKKSKTVNLDRKALLENPGKLTDYVRISPVREGGVVKGYRVKPGKNKKVFKEAGLKSGDLAVELNGIDLTDTQQAFTLMKEFPTMTEMTLSVERDGQLHELNLSIP